MPLHTTRLAIIQLNSHKCWLESGEIGTPVDAAMNVKQCNCYVKKFAVPKNVNIDHMV